jgi:hypothetical protein
MLRKNVMPKLQYCCQAVALEDLKTLFPDDKG